LNSVAQTDLFRLQSCRSRVMDVIAVITAQGDNMIAELTETATAAASAEPKASKKANAGARRTPVAPKKGKPGKKTTAAKKALKAPKGEKASPMRDGSKSAKILDLLKRPGGASAKELMKVTGWQAHSLRGFLSGTVGKKMGLTVVSTKGEDGERTYSVKP
jgi:hypothetical protein